MINGRTVVYPLGIGKKASRFEHAVRRLNADRKARADCLYPVGSFDAETIAALVRAVDGPINIMGLPGTPPVSELQGSASCASAPPQVRSVWL